MNKMHLTIIRTIDQAAYDPEKEVKNNESETRKHITEKKESIKL